MRPRQRNDGKIRRSPPPQPLYPAHAGYPVRRGLSVLSLTPVQYWIARSSRAMTVGNGGISRPSLRANGSRERAPDDRLREAIHRAAQRKNGLLRRFAPRNDVAPISDMPPRSRGADRPRF